MGRLIDLLQNSKSKILYGGEYSIEDLFIAPTIVNVSSKEKEPLEEEIFGPIIPLLRYSSRARIRKNYI